MTLESGGQMSGLVSRAFALAVVVAVVLGSGCASETVDSDIEMPADMYSRFDPPTTGGFVVHVETTRSPEASKIQPAVSPLSHDRTQVIGTLDYRAMGDEGGYCIVDCYPWESLDDAEILVNLVAEDDSALRALYEVYVSADGVLSGGDPDLLAIDDIAGIGMDGHLTAAKAASWALATREKPRTVRIEDGLCVVGTLAYVESYRQVDTSSWAIVDALDPSAVADGLTTQHVLAFLDTSVILLPEEGSYVEVHGSEDGAMEITGSRLPVVELSEIKVLP